MEVQFLSENMERSVDDVWEFKVKGWGEDSGGEKGEGEGDMDEGGEGEEGMGGEGEWRAPMAGEVLREIGLVRKWEEMVGGVEGLV